MMHEPLRVTALIGAEPHPPEWDRLVPSSVPNRFASTGDFLGADHLEPGLVLLGPPGGLADAARIAEVLRARSGGWVVAHLSQATVDGEWTAQTVTAGYPLPLPDLVAAAGGESGTPLLELTTVLSFVARARHDINNPLTSAMAETQLLLMDVTDPMVVEPLETIQHQIRRIRDLVLAMGVLRTP